MAHMDTGAYCILTHLDSTRHAKKENVSSDKEKVELADSNSSTVSYESNLG